MPTQLALPANSAPYIGQPQPLSVKAGYVPPEGPLAIPLNIAWSGPGSTAGDDAGTGAVLFNLNQVFSSPQPFSQIAALYADNTQSGADVTFMFPDRQFEITVPAGEGGIFPVISGNLQFYAVAPAALAGDKTFFQALNYIPAPETFSKTIYASSLEQAPLSITSSFSIALGTYTGNGTLTGGSIALSQVTGGAATSNVNLSIQDSVGNVFLIANFGGVVTGTVNGLIVATLPPVNMRFQNGLRGVVSITSTAYTTGSALFSAYIRIP